MLPLEVESNLTEQHLLRFQKQFVEPCRDELELLWRRTQQPETRDLAMMESNSDRRRRMIHGLDKYAVVESERGYILAITDPYIWFQALSPHKETMTYLKNLLKALSEGGWEPKTQAGYELGIYELNDLKLSWKIKEKEKEDITAGRMFPPDYNILEVEMQGGIDKTEEQKKYPWGVLRSGMRVVDKRGNPEVITNLREIEKFFPMQVELGCGPSIEAGVPPLHYFHTLYKVSEPIKGTFIFGPMKDTFLSDIISNPATFYRRAAALYTAALLAEPTPFYRLLQELSDEKIVVGDVITNNFDGFCSLINLKERYLRRFDEPSIVPEVEFHPEARSLLVVGSHADRRRVEKSARSKGLKVIYVDPEGYTDKMGGFIPYPLESIQNKDILIKMTAQQFTNRWKATFK